MDGIRPADVASRAAANRAPEPASPAPAGATIAIRCRGLRKTYPGKIPVEAVCGLDLTVPAGLCFGLLGPNGAGKTTTVEILEGILTPTAGEVEVLGRNWSRNPHDLRQRIGVSLQETRLPDRLTVEETVVLFASFFRRGRPAAEVLAEVGLTEKRAAWVMKLSGGQKQRLAVACALVGDPELLFLDEPTTGLDPQSRRQLWEIIGGLRSRGRTILLTTHNMDEAERLCDLVGIVDLGKLIAQGSPAGLIASLGGEHVIEFAAQTADGRPARPDPAELARLPGVRSTASGAGGLILTVGEAHVTLPALLQLLDARGLALARLATRQASLEDVFVNLTGRRLRDE